jgi:hypothetical protein
MKVLPMSAVFVTVMAIALQARAYEGMQADYRICTQGAGEVANERIVHACTRLIDNANQKNELVGFFHALRASANTDQRQNCRDAKIARGLLKDAKLQEQIDRLVATNCRAASGGPARGCMQANADGKIAEGQLSIGQFQDAAGRPQSAYILVLPVTACLASDDPDERVDGSDRIHIFASEDRIHRSIHRFVGRTVMVRGRPGAAHTVHHHAPIIMEIQEIDAR